MRPPEVDAQRDVIAFLASPAAHDGAPVERVSTHISHIFLAGDRAFKLKRALKYEFADFSTVELRRKACENELSANRRAAPDMYLGVRAIYADDGAPTWTPVGAPRGAPMDWVVEMARFATEDQFDRLLTADRLDGAAILALADRLFELHEGASKWTMREGARDPTANAAALVADLRLGALNDARAGDIDAWGARAAAAFAANAELIHARLKAGRVRRCHGDLHLANICLFRGEVTPFDAIEFDDEVATIDVLYDLAFAVMDLLHFGRADFANGLLNRYLARGGDYGGLAALPAFASMRAAVRAMALGLAARDDAATARAGAYLDLALSLPEPPPAPRVIAIGGLSGSGKSTLAREVAPHLGTAWGAVTISSDTTRKRLFGVAPETRLGADAYRPEASAMTYEQMIADAGAALRAGQSVVLDATYTNESARAAARALADQCGAAFDGVWLAASEDVLRARVAARSGDASDATIDVLGAQLAAFEGPPPDWRTIDAAAADGGRDGVMRALEICPEA